MKPRLLALWAVSAVCLFASCSLFPYGGQLRLESFKRDAPFNSLVLVNYYHSVLGFDPESLEIKVRIKTSTFVQGVSVLDDGRLVFGDGGSGVGVFGESIGIVTENGVLSTVATFPNPNSLIRIGKALLADSASFDASGYSTFRLFDAVNMETIHDFANLPFSMANGNTWAYGGKFLIGINGRGDLPKFKGFFLRYDPATRTESRTDIYTKDAPSSEDPGLFCCEIHGDTLIILYSLRHIIQFYDLKSDTLLKTVDLRESLNHLHGLGDPAGTSLLNRMLLLKDTLFITGIDRSPGGPIASSYLLYLDAADASLLGEFALDTQDYWMRESRGDLIYLDGNARLLAFDTIQKKVVAEAALSE